MSGFDCKIIAPVPEGGVAVVTANTPLLVIVLGVTLRIEGKLKPTLVTVPPLVAATQLALDPVLVRTVPAPPILVRPVPPLVSGNALPLNPREIVPLDVIGLPPTLRNEGTVTATLVTVPLVAGLVQLILVPLLVRTVPAVPTLVRPVPPLVSGNALPLKVTANVPVVLTLPGLTSKNEGTVIPM